MRSRHITCDRCRMTDAPLRPALMLALKAVAEVGPQRAAGTKIYNAMGHEGRAHDSVLSHYLTQLRRAGYIESIGISTRRRHRVSEKGAAMLGVEVPEWPDPFEDDPEERGQKYQHKPRPDPDRKRQAQRRNCLACGERFLSEWSGHRICGKCKLQEAWRSPPTVHAVSGVRVRGV